MPTLQEKKEYIIGVDFAQKIKWWQKVLIWFGFENKWCDKSCYVFMERKPDGSTEIIDVKYTK